MPGPGAEDVVVATSGQDEGAVFTGTEDGAIWRVSPTAPGRQGRRHRRPAARHRDRPRRAAAGLRRASRRCSASTPRTGGVESVADSVDGVRCSSATTPRSRPTGRCGSPTPPRTSASRTGRPTSSRTPAPGRLLRRDPDGTHHEVVSTVSPSPTASRCRRTSRSSPSPSPAARTVVRHWLTGDRAGTRDFLVAGPAGLPRQHRARQRRADLGHHRQPARPAGRAAPARPDVGAPVGDPDPGAAAAQAQADRAGPGLRRHRPARPRPSTSRRPTTTW